jgi:hypothetical protein
MAVKPPEPTPAQKLAQAHGMLYANLRANLPQLETRPVFTFHANGTVHNRDGVIVHQPERAEGGK